MIYKVKHFGLSEFTCPDCGVTVIVAPLVFWLDQIRRACGAPLIVTSGYRCIPHNTQVKGAPLSRHLIGCAADLRAPQNMSFGAFTALAQRFTVEGGEFISYKASGTIHFAVPRTEIKKVWLGGDLAL